jgi:hypothetical protein
MSIIKAGVLVWQLSKAYRAMRVMNAIIMFIYLVWRDGHIVRFSCLDRAAKDQRIIGTSYTI